MLGRFQQLHSQEEQNALPLPTFNSTPFLETMAEADIEDYLDQAYAALIGKVSYEERQRVRQELRAKLEAIIGAYQELGYSREEAIALMLHPLRTGQKAQETTVQENIVTTDGTAEARSLRQSKSLAFRYFGGASLVYLFALFAEGSRYGDKLWMLLPFSLWLPLITGVFVGGRAETRPVLSTLRTMGLLSLPFLLPHQLWAALYGLNNPTGDGLLLGILNFLGWSFSGTVGAAIGGGLRKYFKPGAALKNQEKNLEADLHRTFLKNA